MIAGYPIFDIALAAIFLAVIGWRLVRIFKAPARRKPSINSGRGEWAALTAGILGAAFLANHDNKKKGF